MGDTPPDILALFDELGPRTDAIEGVVVDPEAAAWRVDFDDGASVLVEWDGQCSRLMVQALLGRPSGRGLLRAYEAALTYNALWRENGNARIGRVDSDGELALIFEVPATELACESLQLVLLSVRSVAQAWTRLIANVEGTDEERLAAAEPLPSQRV